MATTRLDFNELAVAVRSEERIRNDAFSIASSLAMQHGRMGDSAEFRNLLLRAMEHRQHFGDARELLDALVREIGLFPYLEPDDLGLADRFAYEVHKPPEFPGERMVFHAPQAKVYWNLMEGRNVVLSAPTSFGKSLVIDAVVASLRYQNILIVVPTIALIDETRRRLSAYDLPYKLIAHPTQHPGDKNIYVLTQERALDLPSVDLIDFFVIDEFYKLSPGRDDDTRAALLNILFHRLATKGKQFYLLGPDVEGVVNEVRKRLEFTFIYEPYPTVASEVHRKRPPKGKEIAALVDLVTTLEGQSLVFCSSPDRASKVARALVQLGTEKTNRELAEAVAWIGKTYHEDWHFAQALAYGIGVHHGRVPRALAQFAVRSFNEGLLQNLVCTSTLIEGVNTKARNVVVFDNKISKKPIDFFTFNNICGRSGRMFQHFVGHIYLFHDPPARELPLVDVPAFSQSEGASASLLLQLKDEELSDDSRKRLNPLYNQTILSLATLRAHPDVSAESLFSLANSLDSNASSLAPQMRWTFDPTYEQHLLICRLMWEHMNATRIGNGSARSAEQLALKIWRLRDTPTIREQIEQEIAWRKDVDSAVQSVLDFNRLWVSFHFPKLLMAIQSVQHEVFKRKGFPVGDFSAFAARVEAAFLPPILNALDEYGIPVDLARKLLPLFGDNHSDLDAAIAVLKSVNISRLNLDPFERSLLEEVKASLR